MRKFATHYRLTFLAFLIGLLALSACLPGASQQQPAVPALLEEQPVDAQFEQACLNRGGSYSRPANRFGECTFADGSVCSYEANQAGEPCPALTALSPDGTPFPTKEVIIPATPIVKEADPFAGWATYLNGDFDFAFRYPDTWTVEDQPRLVRLTRPGLELLVHYRPAGVEPALQPAHPYGGDLAVGERVDFFQVGVQPQLHLIDGQALAVQAGDPLKPLPGGGNEYLVELYSLQSDAPLSEQALAEFYTLLSSFEPWTN